jgi:hypothetical protein
VTTGADDGSGCATTFGDGESAGTTVIGSSSASRRPRRRTGFGASTRAAVFGVATAAAGVRALVGATAPATVGATIVDVVVAVAGGAGIVTVGSTRTVARGIAGCSGAAGTDSSAELCVSAASTPTDAPTDAATNTPIQTARLAHGLGRCVPVILPVADSRECPLRGVVARVPPDGVVLVGWGVGCAGFGALPLPLAPAVHAGEGEPAAGKSS